MAKKPPYDLRGLKRLSDTENPAGNIPSPPRDKTYVKQAASQPPAEMAGDKKINEQIKELRAQMEAMNAKIDSNNQLLVTQLKSMFEVYQNELKVVIEKIDKQIKEVRDDFRMEVDGLKIHLNATDKKGEEIAAEASEARVIAKKTADESQMTHRQNLRLQCQFLEGCLRLRGVPENVADMSPNIQEEGEESSVPLGAVESKEKSQRRNEREVILTTMAKFTGSSYQELDFKCTRYYRINSEYAKIKNLPRDLIIHFSATDLSDNILKKHRERPFTIKDTEIKIFRELPKEVISSRKNYKPLVDKLNQEGVRFRWLIPEGVLFTYKDRRISITSKREMDAFLEKENLI